VPFALNEPVSGGHPGSVSKTDAVARQARQTKRKRFRRSGTLWRPRRVLFLVLLVLVAILYAKPLRTYYDKREALSERRAQVELLRADRQDLRRRLARASSAEAIEREARRLFYVKPGERLYIVKGIERWRREQARHRDN
jgi:cell division protein FtsB